MRPFFSYYGSKYSTAVRYPYPIYDRVIEPFAGSAGYSIRHRARTVTLIDRNPRVVATWRYLIGATARDILSLPLIQVGQPVSDLAISPEAATLIGWWVNKGGEEPRKTLSAWARDPRYAGQFWGERVRARVAQQVEGIKHWSVFEGKYEDITNPVAATWFVDPPYSNAAGSKYTFSDIDYASLGEWCKSLPGQVIVCEQEGADWLPFRYLGEVRSTRGRRGAAQSSAAEVVWTNGGGAIR